MNDQMTIIDHMAEVKLFKPDNFLMIRETLTRIGVVEADNTTLCQLCHILHKRGRYFITHFKELFALDGLPSDFNEHDAAQRNAIIMLLANWNLLVPIYKDGEEVPGDVSALSTIKIVPFQQKNQWKLTSKYALGRSKP